MNCGSAISLSQNLVIYCMRGAHENVGYHEGPLGGVGARFALRWTPIGSDGEPILRHLEVLEREAWKPLEREQLKVVCQHCQRVTHAAWLVAGVLLSPCDLGPDCEGRHDRGHPIGTRDDFK